MKYLRQGDTKQHSVDPYPGIMDLFPLVAVLAISADRGRGGDRILRLPAHPKGRETLCKRGGMATDDFSACPLPDEDYAVRIVWPDVGAVSELASASSPLPSLDLRELLKTERPVVRTLDEHGRELNHGMESICHYVTQVREMYTCEGFNVRAGQECKRLRTCGHAWCDAWRRPRRTRRRRRSGWARGWRMASEEAIATQPS